MESMHSNGPDQDAAAYRPISGLAVAAAAAGVLSAASLISPACWVVPPVAIALAVAALRDIGRDGSVKVGRLPAVIGLALAVGFMTQAVSYRAVQERLVTTRAEAAARQFVQAVRESRFADARAMCGPTALPRSSAASSSAGGEPVPPDAVCASMPAVALLAACDVDGRKRVDHEPRTAEMGTARGFLFSLSCRPPGDSGQDARARVRVIVEQVDPSGWNSAVDRWQVVGHEVVTPPWSPGSLPAPVE